ncbi:hypothetical protein OAK19_02910 [Aureispira]|nr:hypothetical protein [Aureispira sp.]
MKTSPNFLAVQIKDFDIIMHRNLQNMIRVFFYILIITQFYHCKSKISPKNCIGEWSYCSAGNNYCEILITDDFVLPYHAGAPNFLAYKYQIRNDTFYIYGNDSIVSEMSPIHFLSKDSFQIKGITPSVLKRIEHDKSNVNTLLKYHNKINHLLKNRDIVDIVDDNVLVEINEAKNHFEKDFKQRRINFMYRRENL